jgi:hypothetical protein
VEDQRIRQPRAAILKLAKLDDAFTASEGKKRERSCAPSIDMNKFLYADTASSRSLKKRNGT